MQIKKTFLAAVAVFALVALSISAPSFAGGGNHNDYSGGFANGASAISGVAGGSFAVAGPGNASGYAGTAASVSTRASVDGCGCDMSASGASSGMSDSYARTSGNAEAGAGSDFWGESFASDFDYGDWSGHSHGHGHGH
ncbi:MAG: hypothetical protein OQJ98_01930 [Candidatus Pacebacteria bacterium]|nr:hypothetical protein [Candidatus Paceibacterota bacterium]